jgi:hypothetical protein
LLGFKRYVVPLHAARLQVAENAVERATGPDFSVHIQ